MPQIWGKKHREYLKFQNTKYIKISNSILGVLAAVVFCKLIKIKKFYLQIAFSKMFSFQGQISPAISTFTNIGIDHFWFRFRKNIEH